MARLLTTIIWRAMTAPPEIDNAYKTSLVEGTPLDQDFSWAAWFEGWPAAIQPLLPKPPTSSGRSLFPG